MYDREVMESIVAKIESGVLSLADAASSCGVATSTAYWWLKQSRGDDPRYLVEYAHELVPFWQAAKLARAACIQSAAGRLESRVLRGYDEADVWYQGRPQFEEREDCIGWSDTDVRDILGLAHRFKTDADGNLVRLKQRTPVPVSAIALMLST